MVCLYHLDDDGKCAAAIVNLYGHHDNYPSKFIEMNYGFEIPFKEIIEDETVYIVDFSLEPEDMRKLYNITHNIIWIDHHITAIKKYENFVLDGFTCDGKPPKQIDGIRDISYSGCMLTWLYLTHPSMVRDENLTLDDIIESVNIPPVIRACDDYDMWRFKIPRTKEFHFGFSIIRHGPKEIVWESLITDDPADRHFEHICNNGSAMILYRENMMKELIKSYGYESTLDGYKCFVLNQGIIGSDDFDSIDKSKYDLLVGVVYDGLKYNYSLRTTGETDVSKIALAHGGGGHKSASGFSSDDLLV